MGATSEKPNSSEPVVVLAVHVPTLIWSVPVHKRRAHFRLVPARPLPSPPRSENSGRVV
jgi:hypothetical protein